MRRLAVPLLLLATSAPAQAPATAAEVTEPGRTLQRPLDVVLGSSGAAGAGPTQAVERTLLVVVDASAGLASAGFADAFDQALANNQKCLARTRLGLGVLGAKGCVVLPFGTEPGKIAAEVRARLGKPAAEFQNVYADLRAAAGVFGGEPGAREILLVTLENGDLEDDLEQTVALLEKARIKVTVLTSEATLADSWWVSRPYQEKPRGTTLTGGDSPVIDVPWGWLFQVPIQNEITPAGYAAYGLNRVSAASGGKVFLHATASQTGHVCGIFAECLFCTGDHLPQDEGYRDAVLSRMAPLVAARPEACAQLARDGYFRLVVQYWNKSAEAGLIRSTAAVKLVGTSAQPDRQRTPRVPDFFGSAGFARHARRADEAADEAGKLGAALQAELDKLGATQGQGGQGMLRCEATAHLVRVMLQLARVNLVSFAAWCRDDAPALFGKDAELPLLPELPAYDHDQQPVGIGFTNLCLCHGVRPFLAVDLPGGALLRAELEKLDALFTQFVARYGHSPFGFAMHKAGIAQFHATFPGTTVPPPRRRPKTANDQPGTTTPSRPPRGQPTSGGTTSGPTTGGGR